MGVDQNKALVRRLVDEVVAQRSVEALDEIAEGRFAVVAKRWVTPFRSPFPDFAMEIIDLIGEGDEVVALSSARGHTRASGSGSRRPGGALRAWTRSTSSACAAGG